jgi:hypothetical protein
MDAVAQQTETQLLDKIRQIRSEEELTQLIEDAHNQLTDSGKDAWVSFCSDVIKSINSVNPLYIEDPDEWDILKRARVLIHRQTSQMLAS